MFNLKKVLFSVVAIVSLFVFSSNSFADSIANTDKAKIESFTNSLFSDVLGAIKDKESSKESRVAKFSNVFMGNLDNEYISQFLVGRQLKTASPSDVKKFNNEFSEYVLYSWISKFDLYTDQQIKLDSIVPANNDAMAFANATIVGDKSEDDIKIQLRIRKTAAGYKVSDIKLEGVSMLMSYKKEFASVMAQGKAKGQDSFSYFITFLSHKNDDLKKAYLEK